MSISGNYFTKVLWVIWQNLLHFYPDIASDSTHVYTHLNSELTRWPLNSTISDRPPPSFPSCSPFSHHIPLWTVSGPRLSFVIGICYGTHFGPWCTNPAPPDRNSYFNRRSTTRWLSERRPFTLPVGPSSHMSSRSTDVSLRLSPTSTRGVTRR